MSFSWRMINLFGLAMRIPVIRFLITRGEEQITAFSEVAAELNECDKCHKYTNHHCANAMLTHLIYGHHIAEDRAIQIVADIWKRIFILNPRRKDSGQ